MTAPTIGACTFCKEKRELVREDAVERGYCEDCAQYLPVPAVVRAMAEIIETQPFYPGDRVEAWLVGEVFDGIGVVDEVSIMLEHGGTPVRPAFHVVIDEKKRDAAPDSGWYNERCLIRVED